MFELTAPPSSWGCKSMPRTMYTLRRTSVGALIGRELKILEQKPELMLLRNHKKNRVSFFQLKKINASFCMFIYNSPVLVLVIFSEFFDKKFALGLMYFLQESDRKSI